MYSTSCSTTPSRALIKIAKSNTQMVRLERLRCGLWPLIHQHFYGERKKKLLIAETFLYHSSRVILHSMIVIRFLLSTYTQEICGGFRSMKFHIAKKKYAKASELFLRAKKLFVQEEKKCWERILMFTAGVSQYFPLVFPEFAKIIKIDVNWRFEG